MLKQVFISSIADCPDGFLYKKPEKRDLLGGQVAIFTDSLETAYSWLDRFCLRVHGLIITRGERFSFSVLGSELWHLVIDSDSLKDAKNIAVSYLELIVHSSSVETENSSMKVEVERYKRDNLNLRNGYNQDTERLSESITKLRTEIEKRNRAETEMAGLKNYLANIIDSMPSILFGIDPHGLVTQWNLQAEKFTGLPPEKALAQPFNSVLPILETHVEIIKNVLATGNQQSLRHQLKSGDNYMYQDVVIYPLTANGTAGAVIRIDDVTEQVKIEEMIVQNEKMMSIGGMAAGMAHEINNPLGIITQAVQNIKRRLEPDRKANLKSAEKCGVVLVNLENYLAERRISVMLEDIQEAGVRAASIITHMLKFSRSDGIARQSFAVNEVIEKAIELLNHDYDLNQKFDFRHIKIVREYALNLPKIYLIKNEMEQVFLNLLKNAAYAIFNSDTEIKNPLITIRTSLESGKQLKIELRDNGSGMDEKTRKRIFEPFFTTKPVGSGTGLGLSVSFMIITRNHKGLMDVNSQLGVGTTFIIRLPIREKSENCSGGVE